MHIRLWPFFFFLFYSPWETNAIYLAHPLCSRLPNSWPRCRTVWAYWRWAWTFGRLSLSVPSSCPLWTTLDFQPSDPSHRTPEKRPGNGSSLSPMQVIKIYEYIYIYIYIYTYIMNYFQSFNFDTHAFPYDKLSWSILCPPKTILTIFMFN
jgi:hypothetical protein